MPITKKNQIILITSFILGLLTFAFYQSWIVVRWPVYAKNKKLTTITNKKTFKLIYWHDDNWHTEDVGSIWSANNTEQNIQYLVNNWLSLLEEEKVMPIKVTLQSVMLSPSGNQAFLSFDRQPFNLESSTLKKLMWIEGLLRTLKQNMVTVQSVHFLVHHAHMDDDHLDFSFAWPLEGFLQSSTTTNTDRLTAQNKSRGPFTIMIDPSGDAKHAGRTLDDSFERGITLQCAQALKNQLERQYSNIRIVLTRFPGETLEPLQNANFANRLNIDCYLSIHFYQDQHETRPKLYLYQYLQNSTDLWQKNFLKLTFLPYDQAHLVNSQTTHQWATHIQKALQENKKFDIKAFHSMPFAPLKGIKAPAIGIEASLGHKTDWQRYVCPLSHALGTIINANK